MILYSISSVTNKQINKSPLFHLTGCNPSAISNSELQILRDCFKKNEKTGEYEKITWKSGCDAAELVKKENGITYQIGGPVESTKELCGQRPGLNFLFPYEASFVVNFTIAEDNTPQGCGVLDGDWRLTNQRPVNEPNYIYAGKHKYQFF